MDPVAEKRRFARVPFEKEVEILSAFPPYPADFHAPAFSGRSHDISSGGIGFEAERPLKAGSFLKLRFELEKDHRVEAFGKIVWAKENLFGLSFYTMTRRQP